MGMAVVLAGNPISGFNIYGPFKTEEEASASMEDLEDQEWWVMPLHHPDEY